MALSSSRTIDSFARLSDAGRRLDARGIPEHVDPALIREAICGAPELASFPTPQGGLGVYTFTPRARHPWHEAYLDEAYLRLIERLAEM
jgi:hypothetical protein